MHLTPLSLLPLPLYLCAFGYRHAMIVMRSDYIFNVAMPAICFRQFTAGRTTSATKFPGHLAKFLSTIKCCKKPWDIFHDIAMGRIIADDISFLMPRYISRWPLPTHMIQLMLTACLSRCSLTNSRKMLVPSLNYRHMAFTTRMRTNTQYSGDDNFARVICYHYRVVILRLYYGLRISKPRMRLKSLCKNTWQARIIRSHLKSLYFGANIYNAIRAQA